MPFTSISAHCPLPRAGIYIASPRHYLHSKTTHSKEMALTELLVILLLGTCSVYGKYSPLEIKLNVI